MITGIIEDIESKLLTQIFKEKNEELHKMYLVPTPLPDVAVKGISWIADDESICDYLIVSNIQKMFVFITK